MKDQVTVIKGFSIEDVSDEDFYKELARRNDLIEESHNRWRKSYSDKSFSKPATYTLTKLGFSLNIKLK